MLITRSQCKLVESWEIGKGMLLLICSLGIVFFKSNLTISNTSSYIFLYKKEENYIVITYCSNMWEKSPSLGSIYHVCVKDMIFYRISGVFRVPDSRRWWIRTLRLETGFRFRFRFRIPEDRAGRQKPRVRFRSRVPEKRAGRQKPSSRFWFRVPEERAGRQKPGFRFRFKVPVDHHRSVI